MKTRLELARIEVLRAEGERGRRYRAEWIRTGGRADRLDVTVTDPSTPGEDHGARERVLLRTTGDGVVRGLQEGCGRHSGRTSRRSRSRQGGNGNDERRKS